MVKGDIAKYVLSLLFKITAAAPFVGGLVYFGWTVTYTDHDRQSCDTFAYMTTFGETIYFKEKSNQKSVSRSSKVAIIIPGPEIEIYSREPFFAFLKPMLALEP